MKNGYSKDNVLALGPQRTFSGTALGEIAFPLGGIGTGSVALTGRGGLKDMEIFNRPNFGPAFPFTFPIVYAKEIGKEPVCRVLQAPALPPHTHGGGGDPHVNGEGFPHMDSAQFRGEYPFAHIDFKSRRLPVKVALEAYNPFIPGNPDDSGFPAAVFRYTVTNTGKTRVQATVAWSLWNPIGTTGAGDGDASFGPSKYGLGQNVNEYVDDGTLRGLSFSSKKWAEGHPRHGSLALVTPSKRVTHTTHWLRSGWFTPKHDFWNAFSSTGQLPQHSYGPSEEGQTDAGALGVCVTLKPGESKTATFYLTWYFPVFEKYWHNAGSCCASPSCASKNGTPNKPTWKNYYASQFDSALDVAAKLHAKERTLYKETCTFHDALFSSTMPPQVLDAVSSQMSILKTATCVRLEDGAFYGFEGCSPASGCCEGSCTHVWNYQQTLPFLFPNLERSMREADYTYNEREKGGLCFRLPLPIGSDPGDFHACADGQMGGVLKTYRDWKICGNDVWLKKWWPKVKRALEDAWELWDPGKTGVMDRIQHNTYDIEFLGPNPMMACFYLGALAAGSEMADHVGDGDAAAEYRAVYEKGSAWIDEHLFNGEYYIQQYDPEKAPTFQFGEGCLSDALLGQWMTSLCGLGHVLDPKRIKKTLRSTFKHNWRRDLSDHANAQRVYALNDEAGLLLCSWPRGGRPAVPFIYSDEVWTGIEYAVASHCIMEGLVAEGLKIVQGARNRHDGLKRNPWDEFECGHHYARAMAAYGLLLALSGFTFDKGAGIIGFEPRISPGNFKTFWALDGVWGTYARKGRKAELNVLWGGLTLSRIDLPGAVSAGPLTLTVGKRRIAVEADEFGSITLPRTLNLRAGQTLSIML
ncbi:MAG: hypothetical protein GWP08_10105 [Nitrospiraceae bacterium]|nr:hypothetical protein [Nitrospiraceae bacterium]